jgi:hypothetical protein
MLMAAHKTQRMASALTFLERYHKDGDQFLSHILWVSGDETWISIVNVETKEQSKQWMHTCSPNKPKNFKQTLSACQKADGNRFLGQESSADGGIHVTQDHSNIRSVLWNNKKTALGRSEQKAWNADIRCSAPPWQCASAYSCSRLSTAGAFQLGVVWPPSLQPWSHSERLPHIYLPEELVVGITAFEQ